MHQTSVSESKVIDITTSDVLMDDPSMADIPDVVKRLEDFFLSPEITTALGSFVGEKAQLIDFDLEMNGEHSHETFALFNEYTTLVEKQLVGFDFV